jgi:hypothetical protein
VSLCKVRLLVWLSATALFGCGDASVYICIGDPRFCASALSPFADAGPDQTVAEGDLVTLDGSNSRATTGTIQSYSWTQTSGPPVTLSNADQARATFIAPNVTSSTSLSFRLTVIDSADRGDTATTLVTVQPLAVAALSRALELFAGPLQPTLTPASVVPDAVGGCPSSTLHLQPDQATAQRGLWLAGRSIAVEKGVDGSDAKAFLDTSRALLAERPTATRDIAGQIESMGYTLLGAVAQERDPALHVAVANRLRGAAMFDDPAGLLSGRIAVRHGDGIAIEAVPDPAVSTEQAVARLLASRFACVDTVNALDLTAAGLRVIADTDAGPRTK